MRGRTKYSVTFKASCKDKNVKWNDEITIHPRGALVSLRIQSEAHYQAYFTCP